MLQTAKKYNETKEKDFWDTQVNLSEICSYNDINGKEGKIMILPSTTN